MALTLMTKWGAAELVRCAPAACLRLMSSSKTPAPVPIAKLTDNFLDGTSSTYLEEIEKRYNEDPSSVDTSWASFFRSLDYGVAPEAVAEAYHAFQYGKAPVRGSPLSMAAVSNQTIHESMRLLLMVRSYQVNGHFAATLDPLGLDRQEQLPIELDPGLYGFSDADMDRQFFVGTWNMSGFLHEGAEVRSLREILDQLRSAYCGNIGFEYMHIPSREKCNWLRERIEISNVQPFSFEKRKHTLDRLAWSDMFETFLANKYSAAKRFGLEGCETLIPGMKAMIDRLSETGAEMIVLGMPHRGRLNVLANVMRKPLQQIFSEFTGSSPQVDGDTYTGSGDVKYHLGTSFDRPTNVPNKHIHLSLMANPSHLEAVNTCVLGKVRARQWYVNDHDRSRIIPLLLHGDGSFSGQGIVYETLDMSGLPDYTVGGCIHIVVNNQVAFTTDPKKSRSSPYCTDVAKALNAPIFHVNGDDVESVIRVMELAADWRQRWKSDVVIDLVSYRKHGHNEIDEPMFTQPLMYNTIKKHKGAHQQYYERLIDLGLLTKADVKEMHDKVLRLLSEGFEGAKTYQRSERDWLASVWEGFKSPKQLSMIRNTGVPMDQLLAIGRSITTLPDTFTPHRQIKKVYEARKQMFETPDYQGQVDWATAEALAFATLLAEGNHVRLSGQDVERGTFSHRHAVVHDQKTGATHTPLNNFYPGQKPGQFTVSNSSLSEFGVLGFELGYSMDNPNSLVLWEAQFGDFANGAQIIFDQFLSSGEAKWLRQSGLTVLLPHGYDGQGPEHSSARLERFLLQSDENPYALPDISTKDWFTGGHLGTQVQASNWQVVNCTTPANYFHVLRRQIHRQFRKPLIMFTPKNLLRHPSCRSFLWEFDDKPDDAHIQGVRFKRLIMDEAETDRSPQPPPKTHIKRLVLCSGKIYYELAQARASRQLDNIAICRVEQLAPFPYDLVMRELRRYPQAEVVWCQEEPMNMGAYLYVQPRLQKTMRSTDRNVPFPIKYAGRSPSASTATGFGEVHAKEQSLLIDQALDLSF